MMEQETRGGGWSPPSRWATVTVWAGRVLVVLAVLADSWWVAVSTPFSSSAAAAVSVGGVVIGVVALRSFLRRLREGGVPARPTGALAPWLVVIAALLALELVAYVAGAGNRHAFPTLSSLYDAASRTTAVKATMVALWLAMGWGLFRR